MGFSLTLGKESNCLYTEFKDAYWVIKDISYSTTDVSFILVCYPSREARKQDNCTMGKSKLPVGGPSLGFFKSELYRWRGQFAISDLFPKGIPVDPNAQASRIYSFVKSYTGLKFKDVLEKGQEVIK